MKLHLSDLPLRQQITTIIVLTCVVALGLATAATLVHSYQSSFAEFVRRQSTLAKITADNSSAAVAFRSQAGAMATLSALGAESAVLEAIVVDREGDEIARYARDPGRPFVLLPAAAMHDQLPDGVSRIEEPVVVKEKRVGTLYVLFDLGPIKNRLWREALIHLLFALLACVAAGGLANRLQRSISGPILELAQSAKSVGDALPEQIPNELAKQRSDEIGVLARSFGKMLADVKLRESALRESEANYRMLTEQASDGIILMDRHGQICAVNRAVSELLGRDHDELIGLHIDHLLLTEDDLGLANTLENLSAEHSTLGEHQFLNSAGEPVCVETNTKFLEDGRIQTILRDASERKRLEEELRQAQKMEALGKLAGGIAHDFNNLLTVICGFSEQILLSAPDTEHREDIEVIMSASTRAAELTRQLLAFGKRQVLRPEIIDLAESSRNIERMLGRVIGEHVVLETHVEERLQLVRFDPAQIEQIIINLVVNARDAMMPDGGQITVAIRNRKLREPLYREEGTIPLGDYVTLSVADTGSGISPENVSHIFEPFFTTKEVGQGTGLGLSTLYGILKQSNGHVTVETELGVGTIFEIYLPVALDREKSERVIRSQPSVPTNSGCVLLVEDEALVRNYAKRALEGLGYRVLEASGPTQARQVAATFDGTIDLLLTDVVMPEMNGRDLARLLCNDHRDMKVLFMSGYPGATIDLEADLKDGARFLAKPFTVISLANSVRALRGEVDESP